MQKQDIVGSVMRNLPLDGRRAKWEDAVEAKHKNKLESIRAAWAAGKFGRRIHPAAKAIARTLADEGIAQIGLSGVIRWLRAN